MTDRLSDKRMEQIRARIRRDTVCPYGEVKGAVHRWSAYESVYLQCLDCGHIITRGNHLREVMDLFTEAERLRELDDMSENWEERLGDLQAEHQRQGVRWDQLREGLTAEIDRLKAALGEGL